LIFKEYQEIFVSRQENSVPTYIPHQRYTKMLDILAEMNDNLFMVKRGNKMKQLEYIGVFFAAIGFACLSFGYMPLGFGLGIISCFCLIPYFVFYTGQRGLFLLQSYFMIFNFWGFFSNV
jgi:hypothetical protein